MMIFMVSFFMCCRTSISRQGFISYVCTSITSKANCMTTGFFTKMCQRGIALCMC